MTTLAERAIESIEKHLKESGFVDKACSGNFIDYMWSNTEEYNRHLLCGFSASDPQEEQFHRSLLPYFVCPILQQLDDWLRTCESPIERVFGHALMAYSTIQFRGLPFTVLPQAKIGNFRVDFLLGHEGAGLIVECDGHDFHERTKEQAQRDKSRDRELVKLGYAIFRFTGSEIWNDPFRCAKEVTGWFVARELEKRLRAGQ